MESALIIIWSFKQVAYITDSKEENIEIKSAMDRQHNSQQCELLSYTKATGLYRGFAL